jgi:erythrin-vacuolar iron transport family protein
MASEEDEHRSRLIEEHRRRFGDTIVLIRREHVADSYHRRPVWLIEDLGLERIRDEAARMEVEARVLSACRPAHARCRDTPTAGQLAAVDSGHQSTWQDLLREHLPLAIAAARVKASYARNTAVPSVVSWPSVVS